MSSAPPSKDWTQRLRWVFERLHRREFYLLLIGFIAGVFMPAFRISLSSSALLAIFGVGAVATFYYIDRRSQLRQRLANALGIEGPLSEQDAEPGNDEIESEIKLPARPRVRDGRTALPAQPSANDDLAESEEDAFAEDSDLDDEDLDDEEEQYRKTRRRRLHLAIALAVGVVLAIVVFAPKDNSSPRPSSPKASTDYAALQALVSSDPAAAAAQLAPLAAEANATRFRSLLLAAHYGLGEHRRALELACEYVRAAPADRTYLQNIHASLRALAVNPATGDSSPAGLESAGAEARRLQQTCGSDLFSDIWPAIRYGQMQMLLEGRPRYSHPYSMGEADRAYLIARTDLNRTDLCYRAYFLDEFDAVGQCAGSRLALMASVDKAVLSGTDEIKAEAIRVLLERVRQGATRGVDIDSGALSLLLFDVFARQGNVDAAAALYLSMIEGEAKFAISDRASSLVSRLAETDPTKAMQFLVAAGTASPEHRTRLLSAYLLQRASTAREADFARDIARLSATSIYPGESTRSLSRALVAASSRFSLNTVRDFFIWARGPEQDTEFYAPEAGLRILVERFGVNAISRSVLAPMDFPRSLLDPLLQTIEDNGASPGGDADALLGGLALLSSAPASTERMADWLDTRRQSLRSRLVRKVTAAGEQQSVTVRWSNRLEEYRRLEARALTRFGIGRADLRLADGVARELLQDAEWAQRDWRLRDASQLLAMARTIPAPEVSDDIAAEQSALNGRRAMDCSALILDGVRQPFNRDERPLRRCLEVARTTDHRARAFYLIASIQRQRRNYDESLETMNRFMVEIPAHHLRDDILAEIGWTYYATEQLDRARATLQRVVNQYPNGNAVDNALWWLAAIERQSGNYALAGRYYSQIAAMEASERLRGEVNERARSSVSTRIPELEGVVRWHDGLTVDRVHDDPAKAPRILRPGDRVLALCGQPVVNSYELFTVATRLSSPRGVCDVEFMRERERLTRRIRVEHAARARR